MHQDRPTQYTITEVYCNFLQLNADSVHSVSEYDLGHGRWPKLRSLHTWTRIAPSLRISFEKTEFISEHEVGTAPWLRSKDRKIKEHFPIFLRRVFIRYINSSVILKPFPKRESNVHTGDSRWQTFATIVTTDNKSNIILFIPHDVADTSTKHCFTRQATGTLNSVRRTKHEQTLINTTYKVKFRGEISDAFKIQTER